jgi:hypothetical protein
VPDAHFTNAPETHIQLRFEQAKVDGIHISEITEGEDLSRIIFLMSENIADAQQNHSQWIVFCKKTLQPAIGIGGHLVGVGIKEGKQANRRSGGRRCCLTLGPCLRGRA